MNPYLSNMFWYLYTCLTSLLTGFSKNTSSLKDPDEAFGRVLQHCGSILEVGSILAVLLAIFTQLDSMDTLGVLLWSSGLLYYPGKKIKRFGKRLALPRAKDLYPANISHLTSAACSNPPQQISIRRPVLYLRSFENDEQATKPILTSTADGMNDVQTDHSIEEMIGRAFQQVGPPLAVSKPNVERPEIGVTRTLLSDKEWQDDVTKLMRHAALVVVWVGMTPGVLWEIRTARDVMCPRRLVLLIPYRKHLYEKLRAKIGGCFPYGLPEYRRNFLIGEDLNGLVYFDEQWRGIYVPLGGTLWTYHGPTRLDKRLHAAAAPIFRSLGLKYRSPPQFSLIIHRCFLTFMMAIVVLMGVISNEGLIMFLLVLIFGTILLAATNRLWEEGEWQSWN